MSYDKVVVFGSKGFTLHKDRIDKHYDEYTDWFDQNGISMTDTLDARKSHEVQIRTRFYGLYYDLDFTSDDDAFAFRLRWL